MMSCEEHTAAGREDLRPNLPILLGAGLTLTALSLVSLPLPAAIASVVLGALMFAGAEIDARTYLLPDFVTWGGMVAGIFLAPVLDSADPWWSSTAAAAARAAMTASAVALLRACYGWLRNREGLGFGDVKLAAAVGAWLPLAFIPFCFALATCAALVAVMLSRLRGESFEATSKLPFGAFLCPALWLVFYAVAVSG